MVVAVGTAVIGTIKTIKDIGKKKEEIAKEIQENSSDIDTPVDMNEVQVPAKEIVKIVAKNYIPTVASLGLSTYCSIASTKEGLKRTAAMAAAYQLSESAFTEFRKATSEVVGEKKESEIDHKIMKDRMERITDDEGHIINVYDTRDGSQLCYDYWCGRYFYSDVEYVRSQINRVNEMLLKESIAYDGYVSLNDVYRSIGLPETGVGDAYIWQIKNGGLIELKQSTYITVDDRPCWVMAFRNPPEYTPPWMQDRL